jgi:hypothetical protein
MKQAKKDNNQEIPKETLAEHFPDLEKVNVRRYLNENLKELYKEVEDECATFKENVFLRQINNLEEYMVSIEIIILV